MLHEGEKMIGLFSLLFFCATCNKPTQMWGGLMLWETERAVKCLSRRGGAALCRFFGANYQEERERERERKKKISLP